MGRGLRIIDALAEATGPLSVRDLADVTGLPRSTAHRLAGELVAWGALDRTDSGYQLGLRLFEVGGLVPRQRRLLEAARPYMEDLYEATRRVVQIGILDGTDVVYLARVGRQGHQVVAADIPGRMPATCTAMGKALLAHDPDALRLVLSGELPRRTQYSIVDRALLRTELGRVQRVGTAVEREEAKLGLVCVAAPIVADGRAEAALSVTGPTNAFDPEHAAAAVRASVLGISRALDPTDA